MMEIRNEDEGGRYGYILLGYGGALLWLVSGEVNKKIYIKGDYLSILNLIRLLTSPETNQSKAPP